MKLPKKLNLANLPTKIEKLERLSEKLVGGPNIFIKRDDQTGTEISGNKIRKLEFSIREALDENSDVLITCGGIQSNHARATAAIATKLGLKSVLVLRTDKEKEDIDGNYFLDKLLGADIRFISSEDYSKRRTEIMNDIKDNLKKEGLRGYIIPEGASNGIGNFGYYNALLEILDQQKEMNVKFDMIVCPVGSGATYGGMFLANKLNNTDCEIYGVNVSGDAKHFKDAISNILKESFTYTDDEIIINKEEINIIDGYVGRGYAISRPEELEFIYSLAKLEGVILDPVYTGKAMYGLVQEIKKGRFTDKKNILFIHTGGLFGLFPKKELMEFK